MSQKKLTYLQATPITEKRPEHHFSKENISVTKYFSKSYCNRSFIQPKKQDVREPKEITPEKRQLDLNGKKKHMRTSSSMSQINLNCVQSKRDIPLDITASIPQKKFSKTTSNYELNVGMKSSQKKHQDLEIAQQASLVTNKSTTNHATNKKA